MRVFLSSTHADLQAHRIAVLDAIAIEQWHCDHDEHWGSRDSDPAAFCVRRISEADVVVLVAGVIFGSVPAGDTRSYTEIEYATAIRAGVPVLYFSPDFQELLDAPPDDEEGCREAVATAANDKAATLVQLRDFDGAAKAYAAVIDRFAADGHPPVRVQVARARRDLSVTEAQRGRLDAALSACQALLDAAPDEEPGVREQVAKAGNSKAFTLASRGDLEGAVEGYTAVIERFSADDHPSVRVEVARARRDLGVAEGQRGRREPELAAYEALLDAPPDDEPGVREQVALAGNSKAITLGNRGDHDAAVRTYESVIQRFSADDHPLVRVEVARARLHLGVNEGRRGRVEPELAAYRALLDAPADDEPGVREHVATAGNYTAITLADSGDLEGAVRAYESVVRRFSTDHHAPVRVQVAFARLHLGLTEGRLGRVEPELAAYRALLDAPADDEPGVREHVATAGNYTAITLADSGDLDGAVRAYESVVQRFSTDGHPPVRVQVTRARLYLGVTEGQRGRVQSELAAYRALLDASADDEPGVREHVATAGNYTAITLADSGDLEGAVRAYESVVERFSTDDHPPVRVQVASARRDLGVTQGQRDRSDLELAAYQELLDAPPDDEPGVREQVAMAGNNKAITLADGEDLDGAVHAYEWVIQRFSTDDHPRVRVQVARARRDLGFTQGQRGHPDLALAAYQALLDAPADDEPGVREVVAMAGCDRGSLLHGLGEDGPARDAFRAVLERFGADHIPSVRQWTATARFWLALCHYRAGDLDAAWSTTDHPAPDDTATPEEADLWTRLLQLRAYLAWNRGDLALAVRSYDEVVVRASVRGTELRDLHFSSVVARASVLETLGSHDAADAGRSALATWAPASVDESVHLALCDVAAPLRSVDARLAPPRELDPAIDRLRSGGPVQRLVAAGLLVHRATLARRDGEDDAPFLEGASRMVASLEGEDLSHYPAAFVGAEIPALRTSSRAVLEQALAAEPTETACARALAVVELAAANQERAVEHAERAVRYDSGGVEARTLLIAARARCGRGADAVDALAAAVRSLTAHQVRTGEVHVAWCLRELLAVAEPAAVLSALGVADGGPWDPWREAVERWPAATSSNEGKVLIDPRATAYAGL